MRFTVESWAPEYGSPDDATLLPSESAVDAGIEVPLAQWAPQTPAPGCQVPATIVFVDGVRRVDARVWIAGPDANVPHLGLCATYGAGAVRSAGGRAELVGATVESGLFTAAPTASAIATASCGTYGVHLVADDTAEALILGVQNRMADLEAAAARSAGPADLVVLDGPLRDRTDVAGAVGYVKTHRSSYLQPAGVAVVAALAPGERSPLFTIAGPARARLSWYVRLPGGKGHAWAGVVRCEIANDRSVADAAAFADMVTAAVPRFASRAHRDPRAPQNLVPIGGLEKALRHRLGDPKLRLRALSAAAGRISA